MRGHGKLVALVGVCLGSASFCWAASSEEEQPSQESRIQARQELASIGITISPRALIESIRMNDEIAFELLLAAGVDVSAGQDGTTPLHGAVAEGRDKMAAALVQAGVEVDGRDDDGNTALIVAAWKGNAELTKLLLDAGADVDATDHTGWAALHRPGNMAVVTALLDAGASVSISRADGATPLSLAAVSYGHVGFVEALLEGGADPNSMQDGLPVWAEAARVGNMEIAELLIEAGADVDWKDSGGLRCWTGPLPKTATSHW